ncbi:hypothetical protein TIFTF001_034514 [Ficus carica]|uniref:Uncharacterized protein n=1 Tax=Ficus carica TaxID=3494 RepID=A0AA88E0K0_FICCA|nr:hypothetical protein TIFTF001_034514 [Ficus carica]
MLGFGTQNKGKIGVWVDFYDPGLKSRSGFRIGVDVKVDFPRLWLGSRIKVKSGSQTEVDVNIGI